MVWCCVQNCLENGVNSLSNFITRCLCDHLRSSAVDGYNWKNIVLVFFASIMKYLISDFQNFSILSRMVTMILKLALNLLAPLHISGPVWAQFIRVSGRLTLACLCQQWPGDCWKGCIWELERDFMRRMAKFNIYIDLLCMFKNSTQEGSPGTAFLESMTNTCQTKPTQGLHEIGLSVMCSASNVVLCVKKVMWVSSSLTFSQ